MPKIWHAHTIFATIAAASLVVSLEVGSSWAWLGGILIGAATYLGTLHARSEWARVYAASQLRAGEQRAGSTDGARDGGEASEAGA